MLFKNLTELKASVGKSGTSPDWFEVSQDLVDKFAFATKDFQWIHTDPEKAKKHSPFGGPIAHGFYSLSLIPMFIEQTIKVESVKMGINYGLNKVRFPHHVPVGSKLKCQFTIVDVEEYQDTGVKVAWECQVLIEGASKPACVAELISLMFE